MGIHSQLSQEAIERFKKQKRKSFVASFFIAFLVVALIAILLAFVLVKIPLREVSPLLSYQPEDLEQKADTMAPKMQSTISKTLTPPRSSMFVSNVLTSTSLSDISILDSDEITYTESLDFGQSDDFGDSTSFMIDDHFDGAGQRAKTSFFGSQVEGENICYVIDYSRSMRGERDRLMRQELSNSVKSLKGTAGKFSLIFFSGPTWQAGDEARILEENDRKAVVISKKNGKSYNWSSSKGWHPDGRAQKFTWRDTKPNTIRTTLKQIEETPLVYGTRWYFPLKMAMELNPKPDVIIFMTDGASGKTSYDIADEMGALASRRKIVVHTVSLMQAQAKEALVHLAKLTGGTATMVLGENEMIPLSTE